MRVAFLLDTFPKTSETFFVSQIVGLIERGHSVDIFARYRNRSEPIHPEVEKHQLLKRTKYLIPESRQERLLAAGKILLRLACSRPLELLRLLNPFQPETGGASLEILYCDRVFRKAPAYDIVHCHFGPIGVLGQQLHKRGSLRGTMLTTFHGYDIGSYVAQHGPGVYRELFHEGNAFTCSSKFIRGKLIAAGCDPTKIILFKLGTDLAKFDFVERSPNADATVRLITVARLVEKKGLEYSIKAMASVVQQFPKLEYTIVGDGPLRDNLSALITELNLQPYIKLAGWKTQAEVQQLFARSHIFVLASVLSANGDFEGQGTVLQEAQASGLPIVCTNHNGFPDSILDGQSGFLVPERDAETLAAKLVELIRRPELRLEMGKKGRAFVESEFDLSKRNDALVELYRRIRTQPAEAKSTRQSPHQEQINA
jgi:colanic acid/amylovoran biosynthesis glycosyltransferase